MRIHPNAKDCRFLSPGQTDNMRSNNLRFEYDLPTYPEQRQKIKQK